MSKPFELSDVLAVQDTPEGAMIYSPQKGHPGTRAPGTTFLVLNDSEIRHLIAWWWCQNGRETANGDMVSRVIDLACDGQVTRRMASAMLRAVIAEVVNNALLGWVMPELEGYAPAEGHAWYSCGNCCGSWPCGCDDPARICDICGGDQFDCDCDERSYTGEF